MNGSGLSPFPLKQPRHCYFKLPAYRAQHWVGGGERNSSRLPVAVLQGAPLCFPPAFAIDASGKGPDAGL